MGKVRRCSAGGAFGSDVFWEHTIVDEDGFEQHFDYIHFNPVKHGHVKRPQQWPWSSFHRYVRQGLYPLHWSDGESIPALPGNAGE